MPEYLARQDELRERGVERIYVYCVNDGAVMEAWAADQRVGGSMLTFLADPGGAFARELDLELTEPGVVRLLGPGRCKRFVLVVRDGLITARSISEAEGDPAGDNQPDGDITALTRVSYVLDNML